LAEAACRNVPEPNYAGSFLNTLGVALYRASQNERALDTLTRSNQLNGNNEPADLVFLALTQYRLGRTEASRANLRRLREVMTTRVAAPTSKAASHTPEHEAFMREREASRRAEHEAFMREAESVILYDPVFPADPFAH
jgi:hypothetical protein